MDAEEGIDYWTQISDAYPLYLGWVLSDLSKKDLMDGSFFQNNLLLEKTSPNPAETLQDVFESDPSVEYLYYYNTDTETWFFSKKKEEKGLPGWGHLVPLEGILQKEKEENNL